MKTYLRRSIFTKAVALGFIVMTLLSNVWLVLFLTGHKHAVWINDVFMACLVWTAGAGCGMGMKIVQHHFQKESDDDPAV